MQFYVYILQSLKDRFFYVGLTRDLQKRLDQHNGGKVDSTRNRIPFDLVYWEGYLNFRDASKREEYLKSSWGKRYIKDRLNYLTGPKVRSPFDIQIQTQTPTLLDSVKLLPLVKTPQIGS